MGILEALGVAARSARSPRRKRQAPLESIQVKGGTARVRWTTWLVPTIEAPTEVGAWQALGRLHAEERLWQLDLLRKAGRGELSRLFGDQTLDWRQSTIHHAGLRLPDLDYFLRCFGIAAAAEQTLAATEAPTRELLWSYTRGINDGLVAKRRSMEHALLGVDPEPWTPLDTAVVTKVFAFNLNVAWKFKLAFASIARVLGPGEALETLLPDGYRPDWPRIARWVAEAGQTEAAALLEIDEQARAFTGGLGAHLGSNSWVLGASRTASGKPVLCGDPHLEATAPAQFFLARVRGGELDASGATIPGVPGVVIGRNRRIAWSMTNLRADDTDLLRVPLDEPLAEAAPDALHQDGLEVTTTVLEIKGEAPRQRELKTCRGARLISPALKAPLAYGLDEALALRWTALTKPGRELDCFLGVNHAQDFHTFRQTVRDYLVAPAQNFSYADVDGHIGYAAGGEFPIRRGGPCLLPRRIDDPAADWTGWVPAHEHPSVLDPPEDVVAHANNEVTCDDYPHYLSTLWEPPHRIRRIVERVRELPAAATVEQVAAIQTDVRSLQALDLIESAIRPHYEELLELRPDGERALRAILLWDGECQVDSPGAVAFHVFYHELVRRLAERPLGQAFVCLREVWIEQLRLIEEVVADDEHPWLYGRRRVEVLADALAATVDELDRWPWDRWGGWAWGSFHKVRFRHPLAEVPLLGHLFRVGPVPLPGSSYTVWNAHYSHAHPYRALVIPSLRFVADLSRADAGAASAILGTGQSGDPLSPHYRDMTRLWLRGERVGFGS